MATVSATAVAQLGFSSGAVAAPKAPTAVEVTGRTGQFSEINGRWQIAFGDMKNGKAVFKRDGYQYYLVYNDCGQFQMSNKNTAECTGFGVQKKGVWYFNDKEDPKVKVQPVGKGETKAPPPQPQEVVSVRELMRREEEKMEREANTETFMGNMDSDDEAASARLLKKMNVNSLLDGSLK